MDRFCDELRAERARNGISLEEIVRITKVPQRHLLALEEGRFTDLPGGIFRKGILRGYLQAIGVHPAPWMARFELLLAEVDVPTEPPGGLEQVAAGVEHNRIVTAPTHQAGWPGVMILLVLLLAFGWCVWRFALRGHVVLSYVAPHSDSNAVRVRARSLARPLHLR